MAYPWPPNPGYPGPPPGYPGAPAQQGFMPPPMYGMPPQPPGYGMPPPGMPPPPGYGMPPPPGYAMPSPAMGRSLPPPPPPPSIAAGYQAPPPYPGGARGGAQGMAASAPGLVPPHQLPHIARPAGASAVGIPPSPKSTPAGSAQPEMERASAAAATAAAVPAEPLPEWLPPNARAPITMFVASLPRKEDMDDDSFRGLLELCGPVDRWDRRVSVMDTDQPLGLGLVTWRSGLGAMRALRLLRGIELGSGEHKRSLVCTVGAREQAIVDDAEDARKMHVSLGPMMPKPPKAEGEGEGDDANMINEDEEGRQLEDIQKKVAEYLAGMLAAKLSSKGDEGQSGKEGPVEETTDEFGGDAAAAAAKTVTKLNAPPDPAGGGEDDGLAEEERLERSLAADVEQFRKDQRRRDEGLERERKRRLKLRVREVWGRAKALREGQRVDVGPDFDSTGVAPGTQAEGQQGGVDKGAPAVAPHPLAGQLQSQLLQSKLEQRGGGEVVGGPTGGRRDNRPAWMIAAEGQQQSSESGSGNGPSEAKRVKYETSTGASVISSAPVLTAQRGAAAAGGASAAVGSQQQQQQQQQGPAAAAGSAAVAPPAQLPSFGLAVGSALGKKASGGGARGGGLKQKSGVGAFAEEQEKKRALIKIDDEEPPASSAQESESARDQRIAETLPRDRESLFAYPVAWDVVDKHDVVDAKLKKWITAKIVEYLGQEERTLIDFVVTQLKSHKPAAELLKELKLVLEDDAEVFVTKLWKILAFHATKLKETSGA